MNPVKGEIRGITLLTNDKTAVTSAKRDFHAGMLIADIKKKFKPERYTVSEVGTSGAIVIDREVGPVAQLEKAIKLSDAILAHVSLGLSFRIGDFTADEQEAVTGLLDQYLPSALHHDGFKMQDAGIGIDVITNFNIGTSPSGEPVTSRSP